MLAAVVGGACVWWVLGPRPVPQGPVLVRFTTDHGVDLSDLLVLPVIVLTVWFVWPRWRGRHGR